MKKDEEHDLKEERAEAASTSQLQYKLMEYEASEDMPPTLNQEDAEELAFEASRIKKMPIVPFFKRLCFSKRFCKEDKWIETQRVFFDEFDSRLDIENIVNDQMNFARFTNVFLTEHQKLLLSH